ncbi:MAG: hypothetical protein U0Z70_12160 [Thermomicrobiales bacterium]|nr:hypothetical protein [Chloroflexia bacterium]
MESDRFDWLTAHLAQGLTRRRGLGLLVAIGAAPALSQEIEAGKHKKGKHKKGKKNKNKGGGGTAGCTPQAVAQTCAGRCGTFSDNCGNGVACTCPQGQCCRGDGTCGACLVFVTSTRPQGDFGGLSGADGLCQGHATGAGLSGTYLAWLSDSTGASPSTRFTKATVPYTLVDGTVIADNWSDLTSGTLNHAINMTEDGGNITTTSAKVWTHTSADGTTSTEIPPEWCCHNWRSTSDVGTLGNASLASSSWSSDYYQSCSEKARLYCFQQP